MSLEQLLSGQYPPDVSKEQLWAFLTELVWSHYDKDVERMWDTLQTLGNAYSGRGTIPFYCFNIRWRSMVYHGKSEQVFDELETTVLNRGSGERVNLRLNLSLYLGREITGMDLWSFFGGSIDSFSNKHPSRFAEILNRVAAQSNVRSSRLVESLRQSLGPNNRIRHGQVYIGIRKPSSRSQSASGFIELFDELPHRLPFELLEFNDISAEMGHWFAGVLRQSANALRDEMGVPRIGEGWLSETALFQRMVGSFPHLEIIQHGRPKWLGRQHFDIWIPAAGIAIEYHGAQHFRPVAFFGGEQALKETQARDKKKIATAKRNGVVVLVVTEEMSSAEIEALVIPAVAKRLTRK